MTDLYDLDLVRRLEARSRSPLSKALLGMYRVSHLRNRVANLCRRLEGGDIFSETLRDIQRRYHGVEIGRYTYGAFGVDNPLPRGTTIGRYASIAPGVKAYRRTRDWRRLALHPFFFNANLKFIQEEQYPLDQENPLTIGNDVWIGYNTIILHECTEIGSGAIIGAGSTVTTNIPPFALAVGSPAKVVKFRFDEDMRQAIIDSEWWNLSPAEIIEKGFDMTKPAGDQDFLRSNLYLDRHSTAAE